MLTQDYPPAIGGIQTYADCLSREWAQYCTDFAVMAPAGHGAAELDAALGFDVYRVPFSSDWMRLRVQRRLFELLNQRQFDVVFTAHWYVAAAALKAKRKGLVQRVFVAAHAQELRKNIMPIGLRRLYRAHRQKVLKNVDAVFPVSHYTGRLLLEDGVHASKIAVVPNGTEVERFDVQSPQQVKVNFRRKYKLGHGPLIGTVARLVPRKGIDTVIEAMPDLLKTHPDLLYMVVGGGEDEARLKALAQSNGVQAHCRFLGKIPYEDLVGAYYAMDCFVMPARQSGRSVEGFGLVFCEASACAIPVIGGSSGGIPDAVVDGKSGLLVPPDSSIAVLNALRLILDDPTYAEGLGTFGRDHVREHGTWSAVAKRIFNEMELRCA